MKTIKAKKKKVKKVKPILNKYCCYCRQFIVFVDKDKNIDYICDKETVKYRDFKGDLIKKYSDIKPQTKNENHDCVDYYEHWFWRIFWFFKRIK
jgi:hypothetical protein